MNYKLSASEIRELIVAKLSHNFGVTPPRPLTSITIKPWF